MNERSKKKIGKKSPFKNWKQKSLKRMEIDRW